MSGLATGDSRGRLRALWLCIGTLTVLGVGILLGRSLDAGTAFAIPALELDAVDLAGHRWRDEDLRGNVVVVTFIYVGGEAWLTELQRFAEEIADPHLTIIGISEYPTLRETTELSERVHPRAVLVHDEEYRIARHYRPGLASDTTYVYDSRRMPRRLILLRMPVEAFEADLRRLLREHLSDRHLVALPDGGMRVVPRQ